MARTPELFDPDTSGNRRRTFPGSWPARVLGFLVALLGIVLLVGGIVLAARGGSWYYLLAGIALVLSGCLLVAGRSAGAWLYGVIVAGTALWTLWESGTDYWAWVPRLGLLIVLGFFVALLLPRLDRPSRRGTAATWAIACVVVVAYALIAPFYIFGPTRYGETPVASAAPAAAASGATGNDWPAYGGAHQGLRYSSLAQIDGHNVGSLQRAWVYRTGDLPKKGWGAETTPVKVGDSVYLCSARNILISLDASTGKERWRFDPNVDDKAIPYTAACRGVAYYTVQGASGECATRVLEGTLDARLVVVDAATGRPCEGFGEHGQVDVKKGMGEVRPGYVSITSVPTIVRGVVVVGHQVLDNQRRDAASGVILGFDAVTGAPRWAWDVMQPDVTAPPPPGKIYTRGTPNSWTTSVGDEALGLVYVPMGNSAGDYLSASRRPAELAVSSSLVALDATTGKPRWRFQTVHHDVWDYDLGSQPSLIDFPSAGGNVPAILLSSKQGEVYVLDRRTGKPLTGVEERPAPQGGDEPAMRTATQPHSTYHTLRKADLRERDMWGISPIDQMICRIEFRGASYLGEFTPPTSKANYIEYPGYNGGSDWGSLAVDPVHGIVVANYNDMPNFDRLVPRAEADREGYKARGDGPPAPESTIAKDPQLGLPDAIHVNAGWRLHGTGMMCKEPPYGGVQAFDLKTGKTLWDRPLGTARANGPFGIHSMLDIEIGTPNNGGPVVTAGGLAFVAAATDNMIRAIDLSTGKTVWNDVLPAGGQATPMVYSEGGREYLVIVAAGHHFMETPEGDYVIAYALPGTTRTASR
ncbi:MAG TPA: membrane-bound PQQ-dependent dehydrogenase, glucose/quinate/shikimate family [Caldimonas sp.]